MVGASCGRVAGRDACVPSLLVITPPAEPTGTRPQRREEGREEGTRVGASCGCIKGRDACVPSLLVITTPAEPAGTRPQRREEGRDAKLVILHESWGPLGKRMYDFEKND